MTAALRALLNDPAAAAELAASGLETIRARHTCAHRVDALLAIVESIAGTGAGEEHRENRHCHRAKSSRL